MSGCKNKNETSSDNNKASSNTSILFPTELVDFNPIKQNPVFKGTGTDTWDKNIRERGYIMKEGNQSQPANIRSAITSYLTSK